jgi:hypothetical protein
VIADRHHGGLPDHIEMDQAGKDDVAADLVRHCPERAVHPDGEVRLEHARQQIVRPAEDVQEIGEEGPAGEVLDQRHDRQQRAEDQRGEDDVDRQGRHDADDPVEDEILQVEPHPAAGDQEAAQHEEHRHQEVFGKPEGRRTRRLAMAGQGRDMPGDDREREADPQEIEAGPEAFVALEYFPDRLHRNVLAGKSGIVLARHGEQQCCGAAWIG